MNMSRKKNDNMVDRYRHTDQAKGEGKRKVGGEEEEGRVIGRVEAVHRILGIMRQVKAGWKRTPQPLPGWGESL